MEAIKLHAEPRTVIGKQVKSLRHQNIIPGVIYGRHIDPIAVQFDQRELGKALGQAGTSAAVQITVTGRKEPYLTIFRSIQHSAIRRDITHVDLQALSLTETVRVNVNVVIVGEAPAAAEETGVLIQLLNELHIEALPTALIASLEVDVSSLTEVGSGITVGDITPPEGVTILNALDETIVQVTYMAEEQLEEEVELGEPALLGESLEEGEEGETAESEDSEA
jgi:large subunit ribosomal protein L25